MSGALAGKVVIVTGGGRGVGRAHALSCAAAGAAVLVNDLGGDVHGDGRDPAVAEAVAQAIRDRGGRAIADASDVGAREVPTELVARAIAELGGLDAVIAAAGLASEGTIARLSDEHLDRLLDVSVRGGVRMIRAASRALIDRDRPGSIVLHTAPVGFFGALRQSALAAASGAIVGLVRSAAIELRKHGIRVNAIAPTARTRTTESLPLFKGIAEGSMGPEFVGPVGAFLASDLASETSGEIIGVAGTRLYAIQGRETPGWFGDGAPASLEAIARAWPDVTRP